MIRSSALSAVTPEIDELLGALSYRNQMSDEADLAQDGVTFWHESLSAWRAGVGPVVSATPRTSSVSELGERIGVPGNEVDWRKASLESTEDFLGRWATEGPEMPTNDLGIGL